MTEGPSAPERFADDAHRYRLESRIATGGMGEVWRGTDTALGRPVAVKLLKHEYADDPSFRSRFVTEAQHAAALHHPGVASVYDFGEAVSVGAADGFELPRPFLVMELVDGQPLSALLRGGAPLDPAAVQDLMAQAADAIGAAHRAGIVHRDVKPANLLVTPDRRIKITDFGIARASDGLGLTGTGQVMGTPQYLSPEQARGGTATPASDVYSLGCVAFECLAGRRPFEADSPVATALSHLSDPVPDLPPDVPADLAAVVRRALSKAPEQRYADGAAFAAALREPGGAATEVVPLPAAQSSAESTQVMTGVPLAAVPVTAAVTGPVDGPGEPEHRNIWAYVLLVAALAAVAAVIVVLLIDGAGDTPDSGTTPSPSPSTSSEPTESVSSSDPTQSTPETFSIDPSDYVGRDVDEVAGDLRALGLRVDTTPVKNTGGNEPGAVESVSPTNDLTKGDTVTVAYWDEPAPTEPTEPTATEPTDSASPTASSSPVADPSASSSPIADPSASASPTVVNPRQEGR